MEWTASQHTQDENERENKACEVSVFQSLSPLPLLDGENKTKNLPRHNLKNNNPSMNLLDVISANLWSYATFFSHIQITKIFFYNSLLFSVFFSDFSGGLQSHKTEFSFFYLFLRSLLLYFIRRTDTQSKVEKKKWNRKLHTKQHMKISQFNFFLSLLSRFISYFTSSVLPALNNTAQHSTLNNIQNQVFFCYFVLQENLVSSVLFEKNCEFLNECLISLAHLHHHQLFICLFDAPIFIINKRYTALRWIWNNFFWCKFL